jgi:hypothetical protein
VLLETLPRPLVFRPVFDPPAVVGLLHEAQTIEGCAWLTDDLWPLL